MENGTVKWFNHKKATVSSNEKTLRIKTSLFTTLKLRVVFVMETMNGLLRVVFCLRLGDAFGTSPEDAKVATTCQNAHQRR